MRMPDWKDAVLGHGATFLPRMRLMNREQLLRAVEDANRHNCERPLWYEAPTARYEVEHWSHTPQSPSETYAVLLFGLWVLGGEDPEKSRILMIDWPTLPLISAAATQAASEDVLV